jgi:hypothetical protein
MKLVLLHLTELLWAKLWQMNRCNFADIFGLWAEYLCIGQLLDFDKMAEYGSHSFLIYKRKLLVLENLIMQALEIVLLDREVLTLGHPVHIVKNVAAPNK